MDRSAVKAIVNRDIQPLMRAFGIPHWNIIVEFEPASPDETGWQLKGECFPSIDYEKARITLNPEAFENEDELLCTLRHELYHIVLSPFDLFMQSVDETLGDNHQARASLERVWTHAIEMAVINLGRMFVGLMEAKLAKPKQKAKPRTTNRKR